MRKLNQNGFSGFEIALIVLVLAALGFAGYTVYQKNKPDTQTPASSQNKEQSKVETQETKKDEKADWYVYQPANKEFEFKVADGWKLYTKGEDTSFYSTDSLELRPGTKGQVLTKASNPTEFNCGMFWDWQVHANRNTYEVALDFYKDDEILKTDTGVDIRKNVSVVTEQDGGYNPIGTKTYTYFVATNLKTSTLGYSVCPGDADYHETVEKVVKTLIIR